MPAGDQEIEPPATAQTVLTALCARLGRGHDERVGPRPSDPEQVKRLAQALGEQAMRCVGDTLEGRRDGLVQASAAVLQTLASLWVACGLSPNEIWIELHKREQLGSLLMELNQAQNQTTRRLLKPWRVDSTKLP